MPWLTGLFLSFFSMPLAAGAPPAAPQFDPSGRWEGAILVRPGEYEIDLQLTLEPCGQGRLCGHLALPTQDQGPLEVKDLKVQGDVLSFRTRDDQGTVSDFRGTASQDRQTLEGVLSEGQREAPFTLSRASGPQARPADVEALASGAKLRDAFNQSLDKTRLVLILSPT
ncbi:MAG TPA: hypothetical protein VIA62_10265 [Thermoanaerobaculia bacterium]|nr:hypothetical protein [Thermoanaerobaculia bacterium]